jgi:hypothetical protein
MLITLQLVVPHGAAHVQFYPVPFSVAVEDIACLRLSNTHPGGPHERNRNASIAMAGSFIFSLLPRVD